MEDMLGLTGKTAIVWGGGQSMGEAPPLRLARAGCDVHTLPVEGGRQAAYLMERGTWQSPPRALRR